MNSIASNRFCTARLISLFLFGLCLLFCTANIVNAQDSDPTLLKVTMNDGDRFIGYTIKPGKDTIRLFDLKANQEIEFKRNAVKEVKQVTFDDAVKTAGLPAMFSWRIAQVGKNMSKSGKIAKVNQQVVYVTLGSKHSLRKTAKLVVFRNEGEIKDPDSGKVLAIERPRIAELQVVEVNEAYSKAKIVGDLKVEVKVGDEVEVDNSLSIAVCPILNEDGTLNKDNIRLVEDLTTVLVNRDVTVVDRSNIDTVLSELLAQNTVLFDPASAQKLGKLAGASHVVVGKVVPTSKTRGTAYVRLVEVETGKIVAASSASVAASSTGATTSSSTAFGSSKLKKLKSLPSYMSTQSRYEKTKEGGIRIQGHNEFTLRKQGAVQTKKLGYVAEDFVFEVVVRFAQGDFVANVGMGNGVVDPGGYNGLKDSTYLRIHNPKMGRGMNSGKVTLSRFKMGEEEIGEIATTGPHLIRISKSGNTVTFSVDSGNDGPSDDDFETVISDIKDFAPFLHTKNSPLFFAGSGEFLSVGLKK